MTIADFSFAAKHGHHQSWVAHHGFAMTLAGCLMFWSLVGTVLYFTL